MLLEKRNIFLDQLFLEIDGVGGDDDPLLVAQTPEGGGEEVGEGFADAGTGLDNGDALLVEGFGYGKGHARLFGAVFVAFRFSASTPPGAYHRSSSG